MSDYFNKKLHKVLKREELTILADFGLNSPLLDFLAVINTINSSQDRHFKYFKKKKPLVRLKGKNGK